MVKKAKQAAKPTGATVAKEPVPSKLPPGVTAPKPLIDTDCVPSFAERRAEGVRLEALRLAVQLGGVDVMENVKTFYAWLDKGETETPHISKDGHGGL